jgi:hypothetical protein
MLVVCELTIALVFGTDGTPYEGGVFRMKLILSHDFPQTPPKGADLSLFFYSLQSSNFVDEVANFSLFLDDVVLIVISAKSMMLEGSRHASLLLANIMIKSPVALQKCDRNWGCRIL